MAASKITTMRLTPEDIAILDAVQNREGLMARSEALRHVLRHYAQTKGIVLRAKPKRKK